MGNSIQNMLIDEDGLYVPTRFTKDEVIETDHRPIIITVNIPKDDGDEGNNITPTVKWNLQSKITIQKYKNATENSEELKNTWRSQESVQEQYDHWENLVKGILDSTATNKRRKNSKKAQTGEIRRYMKKLRQKKRERRDNRRMGIIKNDDIDMEIDDINKRISKAITEHHWKKLEEKINNIEKTGGPTSNKVWKIRKALNIKNIDEGHSIKHPVTGSKVTNPEDVRESYGEYFKQLLKPNERKQRYEKIHNIVEETHDQRMKRTLEENEDELCDMEDCLEVCRKLPKRKSPGPDMLQYEIFIHAGSDMIDSTTRMMNLIWKTEQIPHQWRLSNIKVIYKGQGTKEDLANYRGIFLSSVVCKVFEKMVYKKLEPIIDKEMTENQAGARKGRRTTDHVMTIKTKIEYDKYLKNETYIQFYDIVKCFDKLWLKDIMYDLGNNKVHGRLYRIICLLNNRTKIVIKTPYGKTEEYNVGELVRQGSVLGVIISANSLGTVVTDAENGRAETKMGNIHIQPLCFQDDIAAVGNTKVEVT